MEDWDSPGGLEEINSKPIYIKQDLQGSWWSSDSWKLLGQSIKHLIPMELQY